MLDRGGGGRMPFFPAGLSFRVRLSNNSAAFPVRAGLGEVSAEKDILSGDATGGDIIFVAEASRNGFRETGRGGGSKGERGALDKEAGDAARFRKGLLEERLRVSPGLGRESACSGWASDIVARFGGPRINSCCRNGSW